MKEFPDPKSRIEAEYQEITGTIFAWREMLENEVLLSKKDASDYYSLWVHQIKTPISAMHLLIQSFEEQAMELDEKNYIDGYNLDVDKLLYNEILIGWPMKILCREDCKGICNMCGQNLNKGTCDCEDTSLDPRMSVIRDVFKNFKEV